MHGSWDGLFGNIVSKAAELPHYREVESMSMGFNFNSIGSLFGSDSGSSGGLSSMLGDYSSIKNGSYRKLMKAYYSESGNSSVSSTGSSSQTKRTRSTQSVAEKIISEKMQRSKKTESAESKAYTKVKSASDKLMQSVDKLSAKDEKSLFTKKNITTTDENGVESTEFGYDKKAIYDAVSDYVNNYNSVLAAANGAGNTSISGRAVSMQNETKSNQQALQQLGITVNADNTLSINKDTFMKADMAVAESVFNGSNYTRDVSNSASMMNDEAGYELLRADLYTSNGTYNSAANNGKTYSSTM